MRTMRPKVIAGLLLATTWLSTAAFAQALAPVATDSAGVRVITHPARDRALGWRLEPLWRAGGEGDDRLALTELSADQVALGADGRVAVLSTVDRKVLLFSAEGALEGTLGRQGAGPGEMLNAAAIEVDDGGRILVSDRSKRAVLSWDRRGEPGTEEKWAETFVGRLRWTRAGIVHGTWYETRANGAGRRIIRRRADERHILSTFFFPAAYKPGHYPTCPRYGVEAPPFFTPDLHWDADATTVATATTAGYRVDLQPATDGGRTRSIRRAIEPVRLTARSAADNLDGPFVIPQLGCTISREDLVAARGFFPERPIITSVDLGPRGELWVTRLTDGIGEHAVDVFDGDGGYLGTLPRGGPQPAVVRGEFLLAIEEDDAEVPVIVLYRVHRR